MCLTISFRSRTLGYDDLFSREGQKLPRKSGRAFAGLHDFRDETVRPIVQGRIAKNDLTVAGDDGQQIIEIMSNAAGELADRFHSAPAGAGPQGACDR